jgi:hypothetical protein
MNDKSSIIIISILLPNLQGDGRRTGMRRSGATTGNASELGSRQRDLASPCGQDREAERGGGREKGATPDIERLHRREPRQTRAEGSGAVGADVIPTAGEQKGRGKNDSEGGGGCYYKIIIIMLSSLGSYHDCGESGGERWPVGTGGGRHTDKQTRAPAPAKLKRTRMCSLTHARAH